MFIVLATVTMNVNYDHNMFKVEAIGCSTNRPLSVVDEKSKVTKNFQVVNIIEKYGLLFRDLRGFYVVRSELIVREH